jgi:thioredoxin reductase (NADPH)
LRGALACFSHWLEKRRKKFAAMWQLLALGRLAWRRRHMPASEGLNTVVLESYAPGGQAGASSLIENFFGFPTGISGGDLTHRAQLQAYRFGAKFTTPSQVLSLGYAPDGEYPHLLQIEGCNAMVRAKAVIIATGVDYRRLTAEGREQFERWGVYYAATPLEAQLCYGSSENDRSAN